MLNVWCVCWGDKYSAEDVYILQDMVARNLKQPHRFNCLSDRKIPGVNTQITEVDWPGWWQKLHLFHFVTDSALYLDLDVVVVGNLDRLLSKRLSMPRNWAQSGHGGCQSSVMSWGKDYRFVAWQFDSKKLTAPANGNYGYYGPHKLWGDQEFLTDYLGDPGDGEIIPMGHIYSYKYHCRQSLPDDASVVCFHGNPKPDKVGDQWVRQARSYTATAI